MEDFKGFRFGNIHSSDLHLTVVSSSDRFNKNALPSQKNYTTDVPGGNGDYYFGQTFGNREFTVNVIFEEIDEFTWRRISQVFSSDKLQDLVFDENPYKTYRAKLSQKPNFKYVCFNDKLSGERVYKGEGTLIFTCYHPLAFCFNKYLIKAADNYKWHYPWELKEDKTNDRSKFNPLLEGKKITGEILDHYNIDKNMDESWQGGYQRYKQVQNDDLKIEKEQESFLNLDARRYYENVSKWAAASKLLYSPTLDYDQELIFCPQYSRVMNYNMDTGITGKNFAIGSRLLVYNPGDVPIDFELKLGNLTQQFRGDSNATFRISRYNVQRLTITQAVDWAELKVEDPFTQRITTDDIDYKYGTKYFTIEDGINNNKPKYTMEGLNHPNHCYMVEPIPQEKLGYFIRLFYWQSNLLFNKELEAGKIDDNDDNGEFYPDGIEQLINCHILNCEEGEKYASEYEHLRELCTSDDERNEVYWTYLKKAILDKYKEINNILSEDEKWFKEDSEYSNNSYTYENFVRDYIQHPLDYIRYNKELDYGEFDFNITCFPQYMTFDYFDISNRNFDKIPYADCGCHQEEEKHREQTLPLILNSEKRMIYNWNEPQWHNTQDFFNNNPEKIKNFYHFKPTKTIWNDNIVRGHWFQLPPGWSMIEIVPLVDEDNWGGKRWLDARPFDWGDPSEDGHYIDKGNHYEEVYKDVAVDYLQKNYPYINQGGMAASLKYASAVSTNYLDSLDITELEENYLSFRLWYNGEEMNDSDNLYDYKYPYIEKDKKSDESQHQKKLLSLFPAELLQYRRNRAELGFLKQLEEWFRLRGYGTINDWWWWANHYIWANFPPIYWSYVDLLNKAEIKYIPQYY